MVATNKGNSVAARNLELKTEGERSVVTAYLAHGSIDLGNDRFTSEALEDLAAQARQLADLHTDIYYPSVDEEDIEKLKKDKNGNVYPDADQTNLEHNNSPRMVLDTGLGDIRTLTIGRVTDAQYDGEGLIVETELNLDAYPESTAEAIKKAFEGGVIRGMSIEYVVNDSQEITYEGETIREIKDATLTGAAFTSKPLNPQARVVSAEMKSFIKALKQYEDNADGLYDSPEEARRVARRIGCQGYHTVEVDGNTYYRPCSDPTRLGDLASCQEENCITEESEKMSEELEEFKKEFDELKSQVEDFDEIKSKLEGLEDIKAELEDVKSENEELKSRLEDFEELEEVKSDIDDFEAEIKSLKDSQETFSKKFNSLEEKSENPDEVYEYLKSAYQLIDEKSAVEQTAEKFDLDEEEVKSYVKELND